MSFVIKDPFKSLFPKQTKVIDAIRDHMAKHGFDESHPIILGVGPWTTDPVLIDGHTRLMVADELGVTYVPDIEKYFETEDDALEYAIHNQRNRRNLTAAEIVNCVAILDERKKVGRPTKELAQNCANLPDTQPTFNADDDELPTPTSVDDPTYMAWLKQQHEFGYDWSIDEELQNKLHILYEAEAHSAWEHANYEERKDHKINPVTGEVGLTVIEQQIEDCEDKKTTFNVFESVTSIVTAIPKGKSAQQTANLLGISTRKVEQVRTILAPETPAEIKQAVISGEKSIDKAYNEVREVKKQEEQFKRAEASEKENRPSIPVFNRTNDNIKWAKWTWNPVTGCKHDCYYCYARDLANRFNNGDFEPKFIPSRLPAPYNTKIPATQIDIPGINNVFVCSMSDLFGEWVKQEWIDKVLDVCRKTPQWTYIFLTKNPKRLITVEFPSNSWVGTTVDIKARIKPALEYMPQVLAPVKFISAEPLLEDLEVDEVPGLDWVIIGARSKSANAPEFQPENTWVERLHMAARRSGCKVYWKTNLIFRHPEEYPVDSKEEIS